jgi:uncharacterized protein
MTGNPLAPATQGLLPVTSAERVELLDALRGFALLGILVINLGGFIGYFELTPEQRMALPTALTDGAAEFFLAAFGKGKFYSLFSLLFGIGFAVQMLRAEERGVDFAPRYRRRLAIPVAIGAVHLSFIWAGDILVLYALLGFLLIPLRRLPDRTLLFVSLVLIATPVLQHALMLMSDGLLNPGGWLIALSERIDAQLVGADVATPYLSLVVQGGWADFFRWNASGPTWRFGEILEEGRAFKVLAMFLVGFVVARRSIFHDLERHRGLFRRVLLIGLAVGLIANLGMAYLAVLGGAEYLSPAGLAETGLYAVGVVPLALAYAAAFALLWASPRWRRLLLVMAPAGRMALTNYVAQSVIAIALFYGIGLGWGGRVGPTLVVPLALLIFAAQVQLSVFWLRRFRYGPLEWLWRSLTYGERQPMRLREKAPRLALHP